MKDYMKIFDAIAFTIVVGGALHLGLLGLTGIDLVAAIFGKMSVLSRMVYTLIGCAALYQLSQFRVVHKRWAHPKSDSPERSEKDGT